MGLGQRNVEPKPVTYNETFVNLDKITKFDVEAVID